MSLIQILMLVIFALLIGVIIFGNRKKTKKPEGNLGGYGHLLQEAEQFLDNFRTASAGIESNKELEMFLAQHKESIVKYQQLGLFFRSQFNQIKSDILKRISQ